MSTIAFVGLIGAFVAEAAAGWLILRREKATNEHLARVLLADAARRRQARRRRAAMTSSRCTTCAWQVLRLALKPDVARELAPALVKMSESLKGPR